MEEQIIGVLWEQEAGAPPIRLPAARVGAGGHPHESQEAAASLSRGGASGTPPVRPQADHHRTLATGL